MENSNIQESLVAVIEEAIQEIEDLKKSKFEAQEIKLDGAGEDGIKGHKANGSIGKADDDKDEDEDEDEDEEEKDEAAKADGVNNQADPSKGDFKQADTVSKEEAAKADGKNNEADPSKGDFKEAETVSKSQDENQEDELKKSLEKQEELMKSYVDSKFDALENKISSVLESVQALADSPVQPKGVTAGEFKALQKSNDTEEAEPLNKSYVADKLFELKKSGEKVDSADIIRVETGNQHDIQKVAKQYKLV